MEYTITLTIPSDWLPDEVVDQDKLRQALMLGLAQLCQQKMASITEQTVQALLRVRKNITSRKTPCFSGKMPELILLRTLSTGRIHHLSAPSAADEAKDARRQPPPELPGTPVSEVLIAQRRGDS